VLVTCQLDIQFLKQVIFPIALSQFYGFTPQDYSFLVIQYPLRVEHKKLLGYRPALFYVKKSLSSKA